MNVIAMMAQTWRRQRPAPVGQPRRDGRLGLSPVVEPVIPKHLDTVDYNAS
jgi:hypothetical protein